GPRPRPTITFPPHAWGEEPAAGRPRAGAVAWVARDRAGSAARKGGRGMSEGRLEDLRDWLRRQGEPPGPEWRRPALLALGATAGTALLGGAALLRAL